MFGVVLPLFLHVIYHIKYTRCVCVWVCVGDQEHEMVTTWWLTRSEHDMGSPRSQVRCGHGINMSTTQVRYSRVTSNDQSNTQATGARCAWTIKRMHERSNSHTNHQNCCPNPNKTTTVQPSLTFFCYSYSSDPVPKFKKILSIMFGRCRPTTN